MCSTKSCCSCSKGGKINPMFIVAAVLGVLGYVVWQIIKPYVHSILIAALLAVITAVISTFGLLFYVIRREGGFAMAWTGDPRDRRATSPTGPTDKPPVAAPYAPDRPTLGPVPARLTVPSEPVPSASIDAELERLAAELARNDKLDIIQQGRP